MADLIDLKIQNAMLSIKDDWCNWGHPIDVIQNLPDTVKMFGQNYSKSQYWNQWHMIVVDWSKGHYQILNLPGCGYNITFLNGKSGCKYVLTINTFGNKDPNGNNCNFPIPLNISAYGGEGNSIYYGVWFPYGYNEVSYHDTTFLGFVFLPDYIQNPNPDEIEATSSSNIKYAYYVVSMANGYFT